MHFFILSREFAIVKEWQLKNLPNMNYFNNDKTNQYFDIRTNSLDKILEKIKDLHSVCNLRFLKYL